MLPYTALCCYFCCHERKFTGIRRHLLILPYRLSPLMLSNKHACAHQRTLVYTNLTKGVYYIAVANNGED